MINILAWTSFLLALLSYIRGATAIWRGQATPSVISRFFWLTLSVTNLLSYIHMGAGSGVFLALASTIGSCLIFLLTLRFGYLEFERADIISILGSTIAFFCYLFLDIAWLTLAAGLATHFISGIPTYRKVWEQPYSEDLLFWLLFALASVCSLLGVLLQHKNLVYPTYFLIFDGGMALLLLVRRYRLGLRSSLPKVI